MTILWIDGHLLDDDAARIHPADRGFTLGDGLFETIRVAHGVPLHLDRHLARLHASAAFLEIPVPHPDPVVSGAVGDLIAAREIDDGVVRLTLTRGVGPRGLRPPPAPRPTLLLTVAPAPPPAGPLTAVIARTTRRNEHSPLSHMKTLNYLDAILAQREAVQRGADDALLLNTAGRLAEGSVANLFIVAGGRLLTPPVDEGALPGIRRSLLLDQGAEEAPITIATLLNADEAFLCNSLSLRPLIAVDDRPIGSGEAGPVTTSLKEQFR